MEAFWISITMALMLRVPTPVRCCMIPARMASLSFCCFLHPPAAKSAAKNPSAREIRFMRKSFPGASRPAYRRFCISFLGRLSQHNPKMKTGPASERLQSIAHEEGDANMQDGEDGERITEGPVNDVPELKDLLGTGEEGDALGERGLFLPYEKGALESLVAGGEQSEAGKQPGEEACFAQPHGGSFEGALDVEQKHGKERSDQGGLGHFGG